MFFLGRAEAVPPFIYLPTSWKARQLWALSSACSLAYIPLLHTISCLTSLLISRTACLLNRARGTLTGLEEPFVHTVIRTVIHGHRSIVSFVGFPCLWPIRGWASIYCIIRGWATFRINPLYAYYCYCLPSIRSNRFLITYWLVGVGFRHLSLADADK